MRLPFKLLLSIVKKFGTTTSIKTFPPEMRTGYRNAFFKREAEIKSRILTPQQQLQKTQTAIAKVPSGTVKQIALLWSQMNEALRLWKKLGGNQLRVFLDAMKRYNRAVTLARKPQLQVDTAKSIAQRTIVKKKIGR